VGVAGLPPVVGLLAILPALALYALFGTSRLLSFGTESTTGRITATVVGPLARRRSRALRLAAPRFTVRLVCLVARAVRLGLLARPATVALSATTQVFLMAVFDVQTEPVRRLVLNTEATVEVHIPALDAVDDLQAYVLLDSVGTDRVVPTLPTAVAA
jgi:MFS superfamily sulfate permease-like transporter